MGRLLLKSATEADVARPGGGTAPAQPLAAWGERPTLAGLMRPRRAAPQGRLFLVEPSPALPM